MSRGAGSHPTRPARHDLLIVPPESWSGVLAARDPARRLAPEQEALLGGWAAAGWPVIARRPGPDEMRGAVAVGVPLPPSLGKARVPLSLPADLAVRGREPVDLAEARDVAPLAWRETIDALATLGRALGLRPRVFGALLWQRLTRLDYIRVGSDLDLLWPLADPDALGPLLTGLERIADVAPMGIDGEVLTPVGGIQWRELAAARRSGTEIVLAKSLHRAGFVRADAILGREAAPCS